MILIDCRTMEIVPARPSDKHAALSYVWGQIIVTQGPAIEERLTFHIPRNIVDAIQATLALNLRYL